MAIRLRGIHARQTKPLPDEVPRYRLTRTASQIENRAIGRGEFLEAVKPGSLE
jgi:hypothetical protein